MSVFKAVIFDVGGVLVTSPRNIISQYEKDIGLPRQFLTAAFVKNFSNGDHDNAFCQLECGQITLSEFCALFSEECHQLAATEYGITVPPSFSVEELFTRMVKLVKPVPLMLEAVRKIKEAGYLTGIITNNWIDDLTEIDTSIIESRFIKHFDVVIESCKVGIRKPDPRIYHMACEKLGVDPHDVIFLDDLGVNLKSAQSLGFTTIKVQDTETALQELERAIHTPLHNKSSKL